MKNIECIQTKINCVGILEVILKQVNGGSCDFCHIVVNELVTELKNNATSQHIKSTLKGLCAELPKHLNDEVRRRNQKKKSNP